MQDLNEKVAVVTGGASGIGFAIARRALQEGMNVVPADVEDAALKIARNRRRSLRVSRPKWLLPCLHTNWPSAIQKFRPDSCQSVGRSAVARQRAAYCPEQPRGLGLARSGTVIRE